MEANQENLNLIQSVSPTQPTTKECREALLNCKEELQSLIESNYSLEQSYLKLSEAYNQLVEQRALEHPELKSELSRHQVPSEYRNTGEGVMVTDINGNIISVNHAFTTITGYRAEEVIGRKPSILNSGKQDEEFYQVFWQSLREHGGWNGRLQNRRKNGEVYTEWLSISATRDMDGLPQNYIAVFSDLSKLMATEQRLAFLAYHDSLTGLPNRLLLEDRLEQLLNFSRRNKESLTLIFIDLDLFKQVNDKHGHQAGDLVLKEVANRLQMSVRESDTVARLGGDEFVILAPRLVGNEEIKRFCNKALQYLVAPIVVNGMELYIGASFGCAEYERHGKDAVSLLNHADIAMYRAKLAGGNTCYIYEPKVAE